MRSVVCFKDLKTAALYFDRVVPVAFRQMSGTGSDIVTSFPEPIPAAALVDIVFDRAPSTRDEHYTLFGQVVDGWGDFANRVQRYRTRRFNSSLHDAYEDLHEAYLRNAAIEGLGPVRHHFSEFAVSLGVRASAVLIPSSASADGADDDPIVRVAGLGLVDTSRASWEQILELRRDSKSRVQLQRLRSFLTEQYSGKSLAFVEDDLAQRISQYEDARRKHGFELVTGSISALLDASNLQAATAASLAAAIIGGPWLGASAATLIEVGKASLEFAKRRRTMVDWQSNHELAYIVELGERTE